MEQAELVGIAHVGGEGSTDALNTRNSGFPEHLIPSSWKKLRFVFHNFADLDLPHGPNEVTTTELECHGYEWSMELYALSNSSF